MIEGSSHSRNVTNRDGEAGGYCAGGRKGVGDDYEPHGNMT